jgi:hypothetical protein
MISAGQQLDIAAERVISIWVGIAVIHEVRAGLQSGSYTTAVTEKRKELLKIDARFLASIDRSFYFFLSV